MIDIQKWIEHFLVSLRDTFGQRVWFVGLQGSYAREEATEGSDLDIVVVLDVVSGSDIQAYRAMLDGLPHREAVCGFFSGKAELLAWEPADLLQFYYDTKPIQGSLELLLPLLNDAAVTRAIRVGACNIYHGCMHNLLHGRSGEALQGLYKAASFVLQAIGFRETGNHYTRKEELMKALSPMDREICGTFLALKAGLPVDLDRMSEALLAWAQTWICKLEEKETEP